MTRPSFKFLTGSALLCGLLAGPVLAYPPVHQPSAAPLYQQARKPSLTDYDEVRTRTLHTYGAPQRTRTNFDVYRAGSGAKTFVDLERRDGNQNFELYHKVEDTYEKEPRFSY